MTRCATRAPQQTASSLDNLVGEAARGYLEKKGAGEHGTYTHAAELTYVPFNQQRGPSMNNPNQNQQDQKSGQQNQGGQEQKPGQQQGGQNQKPGQQTQNPGQGGQQGGQNEKPSQQPQK